MKSLKLNHFFAQQVIAGHTLSTWRINDDKDLHVNEDVQLIDKVDPLDPVTWVPIGIARITTILEKQLGKVTQNDVGTDTQLKPLNELLIEFRGYYGQQIGPETPVKIITFTFTPAQESSSSQPHEHATELKLYSDGGSRGNPGPSACGFVLMDMYDRILVENGMPLGITTNNQAEYHSLKLGLEAALDKNASIVHVYMDSMLVINQMKGIYKVKNSDLVPIHQAVEALVGTFTKVTFTHVPRERNRRADSIVNRVLDGTSAKSV